MSTTDTGLAIAQPESESERYASEQTAPTAEDTRLAGAFKYG